MEMPVFVKPSRMQLTARSGDAKHPTINLAAGEATH